MSGYCECLHDYECSQHHAFIKYFLRINRVKSLWMCVWSWMLPAPCIHQMFPLNKPCQVIVNVCMIRNPSAPCIHHWCSLVTEKPIKLNICMIRNALSLSTMHSSNVPSSKTCQVIVNVCMKSAMLSTPCTHQMFPPNKPRQVIVNVCMIRNAFSNMLSSNVPSSKPDKLLWMCVWLGKLSAPCSHQMFPRQNPTSYCVVCMIRKALGTMFSSNVPSSKPDKLLWMCVWSGMLSTPCTYQMFPPNKPRQDIVNVCMIRNTLSNMLSSNVPSSKTRQVIVLCVYDKESSRHHALIKINVPSSNTSQVSENVCMITPSLSTMPHLRCIFIWHVAIKKLNWT